MRKWIKWALAALAVFLIAAQFFGIDKTNPPVDTSKEFMALTSPPADVAEMLRDACYDCHSHETQYPWYANVAPVSWWLAGHIEEGRKELNFSIWGDYPTDKATHKAEESGEEVADKHMPLTPYLATHSTARLSEAQRERLSTWFMALADTRDVSERLRQEFPQPEPHPDDGEESH